MLEKIIIVTVIAIILGSIIFDIISGRRKRKTGFRKIVKPADHGRITAWWNRKGRE